MTNALYGDVARAVTASDMGHRHDETSTTYVAQPVEVSPPVTAKWAKGSGGPAGDEAQNLVAYEIDKERGLPNDEGIVVRETDVSTTITADGDPAERTDRGMRVVQDVATLTAGTSSPGVSAPGRRQEDDANLVVGPVPFCDCKRLRDDEWRGGVHVRCGRPTPGGADGVVPIDVGGALRNDHRTGAGTVGDGIGEEGDFAPTLGVGRATPAVATWRKSRRAHSPDDDETWTGDEVANTLNGHDNASDVRAVDLVVEDGPGAAEPLVYQQQGTNVGPSGTLRAGNGGVTGGVPFTVDEPLGFHATQDPISGPVVPAIGAKSMGNGVAVRAIVRRLTPVECERLQGFPDGWTDVEGSSDSSRYREMGNAVATVCSGWIGWRLHAYIRGWRP